MVADIEKVSSPHGKGSEAFLTPLGPAFDTAERSSLSRTTGAKAPPGRGCDITSKETN